MLTSLTGAIFFMTSRRRTEAEDARADVSVPWLWRRHKPWERQCCNRHLQRPRWYPHSWLATAPAGEAEQNRDAQAAVRNWTWQVQLLARALGELQASQSTPGCAGHSQPASELLRDGTLLQLGRLDLVWLSLLALLWRRCMWVQVILEEDSSGCVPSVGGLKGTSFHRAGYRRHRWQSSASVLLEVIKNMDQPSKTR